ncbi:hypothetical protein CPC08DRAFT_494660 [Agrocybe pediades]|nr:hypothetical protein CPC08DRAFT_494660 [Agrocybe pediades]
MGISSPVPLPPSPASSPRPQSLSGRSSGSAARWVSEGASSNAGVDGKTGFWIWVVWRKIVGKVGFRRGGACAEREEIDDVSSLIDCTKPEYDEAESEAKNRISHTSYSSTSTAPDSAGVDTPLGSAGVGGIKQDRQSDNEKVEKSEEREVKTSRRYGTPSPREFRFPQTPGSRPSSPLPPFHDIQLESSQPAHRTRIAVTDTRPSDLLRFAATTTFLFIAVVSGTPNVPVITAATTASLHLPRSVSSLPLSTTTC